MDGIEIEIKDYYVMPNLHKALLEAKFHMDPDNVNVASSPIIADFCNEQSMAEDEYGGKGKSCQKSVESM